MKAWPHPGGGRFREHSRTRAAFANNKSVYPRSASFRPACSGAMEENERPPWNGWKVSLPRSAGPHHPLLAGRVPKDPKAIPRQTPSGTREGARLGHNGTAGTSL
ncbi:hypothetical protein NCCP1664_14340 [Zafaria cholistanensis]|uniref:Uncharacterized protein n=1 Tax=Zafaria cholistanensis TaxID=1682741 RepID=A0A5A7NSZ6_9MICC|nr:hypothetical protein NCCP1664_14340 [Zafaria cholistanensis]